MKLKQKVVTDEEVDKSANHVASELLFTIHEIYNQKHQNPDEMVKIEIEKALKKQRITGRHEGRVVYLG